MKNKIYYAVINKKWREYGWEDWFYENAHDTRCAAIFGLAIFPIRKEAVEFKKVGKGSNDKIIKVKITPVK